MEKTIIDKLGIKPKEWEVVNYKFESGSHLKRWLSQTVDNTVNHGDSVGGYYVVISGDSTKDDPIFTAITANGPTSEIHANLISAAPELLECIIDDLLKSEEDGWCSICENHEHSEDCNGITSIKKATGKSWEEIKSILQEF